MRGKENSENNRNVGTSVYFPGWALFLTRLLTACSLFTAARATITRDTVPWLLATLDWRPILSAFSGTVFLMLALASMTSEFSVYPMDWMARTIEASHFAAGSLAVASLFNVNSQPLVAWLILLDFALGAKIVFRTLYILLPMLVMAPQILLGTFRSGFDLDHALSIMGVAAGCLLMISISRCTNYVLIESNEEYESIL